MCRPTAAIRFSFLKHACICWLLTDLFVLSAVAQTNSLQLPPTGEIVELNPAVGGGVFEGIGAVNRELWVADKKLYRDGKPFQTSVKPGQWLPADKDIETFSPHVNLLAVLYDIAPKEQQAAIAEKPLNTQPWFMHWVFQAIDHAGLFDQYGTPQMRRWQIVPETQSFREMWSSGDLSHGWTLLPERNSNARK
jgi:hypothetical protein